MSDQRKRVSVVSLKLVRERSFLYSVRQLRRPEDGANLFREYIGDSDREHFVAIMMNVKNEVLAIETVHIGALNSSIVHPREVFKSAILSNAGCIMVAHNHPSGDTTPSREDIEVTERLFEASQIIGIPLLDHIIVGPDEYTSLKQHGHF